MSEDVGFKYVAKTVLNGFPTAKYKIPFLWFATDNVDGVGKNMACLKPHSPPFCSRKFVSQFT